MTTTAIAATTIILVDDHPATLRGLQDYLCEAPGLRVLGVADDGRSAIALAANQRPDVVVLDVGLGDDDGFQIAESIAAVHPKARVVLHTGMDNLQVLSRARASTTGRNSLPVRGLVTKDRPIRELIEGIKVVARGGTYFDPISASKIMDKVDSGGQFQGVAGQPVTLREEDRIILRLVADGAENPEIAKSTGLSLGGVKKTLARLMRMTGTRNRVQLALWVLGADLHRG